MMDQQPDPLSSHFAHRTGGTSFLSFVIGISPVEAEEASDSVLWVWAKAPGLHLLPFNEWARSMESPGMGVIAAPIMSVRNQDSGSQIKITPTCLPCASPTAPWPYPPGKVLSSAVPL